MKKWKKILIILFVICSAITIARMLAETNMKEEEESFEEAEIETINANYELIKEKIINPEIDKIERVKVENKDTPEELSSLPYIVIRNYIDNDKKSKWELSEPLSVLSEDIKPLTDKWSEDDLAKIPVIVFAISHVREKPYKLASNSVENVIVTTEGIKIYLYNTKTKTVFMTDELKQENLPHSISSSHNYTHSLADIDYKIKTVSGRFVMPTWVIGILGLIVFLGIPFVIGIIVVVKRRKKKNNETDLENQNHPSKEKEKKEKKEKKKKNKDSKV